MENLKLIENKGDVKFFKNENGILFHQIQNEKIEKVVNGKLKFKGIKTVGKYTIKYNKNGVYGFSIWNKTNNLEDRIWTLKDAARIAEEMQTK